MGASQYPACSVVVEEVCLFFVLLSVRRSTIIGFFTCLDGKVNHMRIPICFEAKLETASETESEFSNCARAHAMSYCQNTTVRALAKQPISQAPSTEQTRADT